MVLEGGSTRSLTSGAFRATEFTVGKDGQNAMPGELPAQSAYTYAVNLSFDEAQTFGAKTVRFSQPVITYVDNFLKFPIGTRVPSGYYDFDQARWVPMPDGRVIKVLAIDAVGAGAGAVRQGVSLMRKGAPGWRSLPALACSSSSKKPRSVR